MANVQGTFYSATTQRRGVTPVSPPNSVDDPVDPVAPPIGSHPPVTIGTPANGLSIVPSSQVLSIGLASSGVTGALSGSDYTTILGTQSEFTVFARGSGSGVPSFQSLAVQHIPSLPLTKLDNITGPTVLGRLTGSGVVQSLSPSDARSAIGAIGGTIAAGQVAFGTGANTVGGDNGLVWDNTNKRLGVNRTPTGIFDVNLLLTTDLFSIYNSTTRRFLVRGDGIVRWGINVDSGNSRGLLSWDTDLAIVSGELNLALRTAGSNRIYLTNTANVGVNTTSPTNTLDVNGTARIRTISNLGTAATSVLVPSATGVVSLRTLTEFRGDLGATTLGANLFTIPNPSAITFPRFNADNTVSALSASDFRTAIGANPLITGTKTEGYVATIVGGVETWAASAASKWTDVGSDIYRNSAVAIGRTTIPTNATFAVQSLSTTTGHKFVNFLNNAGTEVFSVQQGGAVTAVGINHIFRTPTASTTICDFQNELSANIVRITTGGFAVNVSTTITGVNHVIRTNAAGATILDVRDSAGNNIFRVQSARVDILDGVNFFLGVTNGNRFGTTTSQKLAFWNKTPIIQPTTAITGAAFVANTSGIVNDTATYGGYTIGQVVQALINTGLLA